MTDLRTMLVPLGRGLAAVIDAADAALVTEYRWRPLPQPRGRWYAVADHRRHLLYMHRLILGARPGEMIDHANGNGLDNRRCNLRLATNTQNMANTGKHRLNRPPSSQYKGVHWDSARGAWKALIGDGHGRQRFLGRFSSEEEAARAYDEAALEQWGEFARLNFPRSALLAA